jgi:N-acetylglucosaminyl-diphospho-decaprenol L-rhamnosyltransferase
VDNASGDDTVAMIEKEFPEVRLVKNAENRGVAPARNQIFRMSECEYVIILDVDTVVHPGSLDTLVRTMGEHPEAAITGPKLVYGDGRLQLSCRPFPSPFNIAIEGAFLRDWFPRSRFVRDYTMEDWDHGQLREVDWMYGAAWIIRKTALDRVGLFDEGFFYLYEDIDLCFRMKKAGLKILYDPRATVTHFLPRERKGILHERIRVHLRSILRYLLKDYFGLPVRTKTSEA